MKPSIPRGARTAILSITMLLVASACSIQAPNVILSGGSTGGTGGATTGITTGSAATTTGITTGTAGTAGTAGGSTSAIPSATDTSCVGKAPFTGVTANEIKLGSTFAASGPVSSISGPIFKGVKSYFNKVNAEGGIFGRKINLVWYDDGWDAQKGKSFIKKLVEQDRVFVLSVVPSSNGLDAAASYLESKNMPAFGTSGLIESQFKSPMQWPVGTSTRSAARIGLIDAKNRGVQNFAIIWLDLLAGAEAEDAVVKSAPTIFGKPIGDLMTAERRVSLSETSFDPVWATIQSDTASWQRSHHISPADGRPDFVIFAIDPTNTIKAMNSASQKGFKPKIGWGGGQPLFLNVVAQHQWARATGLYAGSSYYPPQTNPRPAAVTDYVNTVQKYYGSSVDVTNPFLEGGYAGAAMTVEIMKRAGSCLTREKTITVANSLTNFSPAGLSRPLTYKPGDHYANTSYLIAQVQSDGSWKVVTDWIPDPTPGK
jgi:branched-chain amino acid transport system substrate-binding protein